MLGADPLVASPCTWLNIHSGIARQSASKEGTRMRAAHCQKCLHRNKRRRSHMNLIACTQHTLRRKMLSLQGHGLFVITLQELVLAYSTTILIYKL